MIRKQRHISVYWILSFLLYSGAATGQDLTITFKDLDTHEPVVGLAVLLQSLNDGQSTSRFTDSEGKIRLINSTFPLGLTTQHLSYEILSDTLDRSGQQTFFLSSKTNLMQDVTVVSDAYQKNYSTNRDLFIVDEMDRKTIEDLGANDLSEVLNFNSNINVTLDPSTGRSTIGMFGLSGQYVKVLVDNMPIVSDNGLGNDIDISQINLDDVERVEVSEGSMGVMYGSNAVAGVVNIITKKDHQSKLVVSASMQEETLGSEYNWEDEGRHIQRLSISTGITNNLSWSLSANHDDFMGFKNDQHGRIYFRNDSMRGYSWNPKEQLNMKTGLSYNLFDKGRLSYEYNFFQQDLDIYSRKLLGGYDADTGLPEYRANDIKYVTQRQTHRLNFDYRWKEMPISLFVSYQQQNRDKEAYNYDIKTRSKTTTTGLVNEQSSDVWYSKGMISNLFSARNWIGLTAGYELDHQEGYDAIASGQYSDHIANNKLTNLDILSQLEVSPIKSLRLTPGVRLNNNSQYDQHLIWSLSGVLLSTHQIETKLVVGSAYKTPSYTQLFYYFVDANHDVQGNEDLSPEDGISVLLGISKKSQMGNILLSNEIKGYHFDIHDKIGMTIVEDPDDPTSAQRSTYLNINQYQTLGLSTQNDVTIKHLDLQVGAAYTGVRQSLDEEARDESYRFSLSATGQAVYHFVRWGADASVNLKYNGKSERYSQSEESIEKVLFDAYSLLNASVRKKFFDDALIVQLGARNLLDVVEVNASGLSGGAHGGAGSSSQLMAYGRSYFINLKYTFKHK